MNLSDFFQANPSSKFEVIYVDENNLVHRYMCTPPVANVLFRQITSNPQYDFDNCVVTLDSSLKGRVCVASFVFDAEGIYLLERIEPTSTIKKSPKECTCDGYTLLNYGCKCNSAI